MPDKPKINSAVQLVLASMVVLALALPPCAAAASGKSPLDEPDAYVIKPIKDSSGNKEAFLKGQATPAGVHVKLPNLWSTQPVRLLVAPVKKGSAIQVQLRRYHWLKPVWSCSTAESDTCMFDFTNQGDVFIKLIAPKGPTGFYVAVRVGKSPEPRMKPVLVPKGGKP